MYIDVKKPKAFLLENVKRLTQEPHHQDCMKMIQRPGAAAGGRYPVKWDVFNTADFGIPQNRERIYIIGAPKTCKSKFAMPTPPGKKKNKDLSSILEASVGAPIKQQLKSGSGAQNLKAPQQGIAADA